MNDMPSWFADDKPVIKDMLKDCKYWFACKTQGNGCGGAWDYNTFKYLLEKTDDGDFLAWSDITHNDSCNGEYELEGSRKYISEHLWEAEQKFISNKYGVDLPDWPQHEDDDRDAQDDEDSKYKEKISRLEAEVAKLEKETILLNASNCSVIAMLNDCKQQLARLKLEKMPKTDSPCVIM